MDKYIGTIQAAKFCKVTRPTMRKWINEGWVKSYITPGGTARIAASDLIRTLEKNHMPIPDELKELARVRILIVEDNYEYLELMKVTLESLDMYDIKVALNGYEAGIKIGDFQPSIIILDFLLPFINGVEFYKELKRNPLTSKIDIVIVTGYPDSPELEQIKAIGVKDVILKPFDIDLFKEKITSISNEYQPKKKKRGRKRKNELTA